MQIDETIAALMEASLAQANGFSAGTQRQSVKKVERADISWLSHGLCLFCYPALALRHQGYGFI